MIPRSSGGGAVFPRFDLRTDFLLAILIPGDETIQIIGVGPVGTEGVFIEKTLDTATQANLVRVSLRTNWPTHLAVPAASEQYDADTR
jgi:hypothetical protein